MTKHAGEHRPAIVAEAAFLFEALAPCVLPRLAHQIARQQAIAFLPNRHGDSRVDPFHIERNALALNWP